jgi:hypothetical protein
MKVIVERKVVARRLADLTGEAVVYTRMPRCAYEVGAFVIECYGSITVDEGTDYEVFPYTEDAEKVFAFTQLAKQMNKAALKRKRVVPKIVDATNEKYSMRIWLLALGMGGDEFKIARRLLLAPLSGNAAFKDAAMEQRWKEKHGGV